MSSICASEILGDSKTDQQSERLLTGVDSQSRHHDDNDNETVSVTVLGDVHRDTIIVDKTTAGVANELASKWRSERSVLRVLRPGGAWLLAKMIEAGTNQIKSYTYADDGNLSCPETISKLTPYPKNRASTPPDFVYRLSNVVGWVHQQALLATEAPEFYTEQLEEFKPAESRIIVVHDRNNGFRSVALKKSMLPLLEHNPAFSSSDGKGACGTIIWQRGSPLAERSTCRNYDLLSTELIDRYADHLVQIIKIECLRKCGVRLGEDHSVEQAAEDFFDQRRHPVIQKLMCGSHLVIACRDGVLHWRRDRPDEVTDTFCPFSVDEMTNATNGFMSGYTMILTAAIARGIACASCANQRFAGLEDGIRLGVVLRAHHYLRGYGSGDVSLSENTPFKLPHPFEELFVNAKEDNLTKQDGDDKLNGERKTKREFLLASIRFSQRKPPRLPRVVTTRPGLSRVEVLLHDRFPTFDPVQSQDLDAFICENAIALIVKQGLPSVVERYDANIDVESSKWFPKPEVICSYAEFGSLVSMERDEIDQYMSLYNLVGNYFSNRHNNKPLSIATFGPPGSGKSFAMREIIRSIDAEAAKSPLEFNVAQFTNVSDLTAVFHHAHDRSMSGSVPLVVLDEFDCALNREPLGWLKYFLAPMQDGTFKDGNSVYQVGKAVFLFAGGTKLNFDEFYEARKDDPCFVDAKGPDFVSRLRGHLNIASINSTIADVSYALMIRRAILLRSLLTTKFRQLIDNATEVANIDNGLINAFLQTPEYKHGVRSMEAIIDMSVRASSSRFRSSDLPAFAQLNMHVDAKTFLQLLNENVV